jgi:hypothetical protein
MSGKQDGQERGGRKHKRGEGRKERERQGKKIKFLIISKNIRYLKLIYVNSRNLFYDMTSIP